MQLIVAVQLLLIELFTMEPCAVPSPTTQILTEAAKGIAITTSVAWEAETLARILRWEGELKPSVVNCTIIGKLGERGAFQVIPRNHSESIDLCSSDLSKQAKIALSRVKESKIACERLGMRGADVLGLYTHGRCFRGNRIAAFRFGDGSKLRSLLEKE